MRKSPGFNGNKTGLGTFSQGFSIVAIGYEVADALEGYQRQHNIEGVLPFKQLLQC